MALINCPECEKEISDKVKACPHCGYPMESAGVQKVVVVKNKQIYIFIALFLFW